MRFIRTVFFLFCFWQFQDVSSQTCIVEVIKNCNEKVSEAKKVIDIALSDIHKQVNETRIDVSTITNISKQAVDQKKLILADDEAAAIGKALAKKVSIADCLEDERMQLKLINETEFVIYKSCNPSISLLMVELSIQPIRRIPKKLDGILQKCLNQNPSDCDAQNQCINNQLDLYSKQLETQKSKVEAKLEKIEEKSRSCVDKQQQATITMIEKLIESFESCVAKILGT